MCQYSQLLPNYFLYLNMNNLFSIFEPSSIFSLKLNWLSGMLILALMPSCYWICPNQTQKFLKNTQITLYSEIMAVFSVPTPGVSLVFISLFTYIALNNFSGLFPYIFTASSHLWFTAALALPVWVGHMVYAIQKTPNNMLAHLVPLGTPGALMPFMVLIELISNIIRPLTLSVRLAANMVAGHLLLTLMSSPMSSMGTALMMIVLIGLIALSVLETAVAFIQAYVFSVLSTLYVNEVYSKKLV